MKEWGSPDATKQSTTLQFLHRRQLSRTVQAANIKTRQNFSILLHVLNTSTHWCHINYSNHSNNRSLLDPSLNWGSKSLLEALSWSMFLSWSRSRETGWSRTVNVHPSFSSWSSSRFCGSLRGFWSGPMDRYTGRQHTHTHTHIMNRLWSFSTDLTSVRVRLGAAPYLLVSLDLRDQQEFVEQEQIDVYELRVF